MTGSSAEFGIAVSQNVMVAMRDGVRLATDIYRPALATGTPALGRFPAILGRTSYDKTDPVMWVDPVANFFTPRGYVTILQDLRGRGMSEGVGEYFHSANVKEGVDGYDTIEWIGAQDWCTGRVGMVGSSHGGIVQNMAALTRPPHLTALWVDVAPTKFFDGTSRQGGAMALHMYGALFLHGFDAPEIRDDPAARRRIERGAERLRDEVMKWPLKKGHTPIAAVPNLEKILFHYCQDGTYNEFWRQECVDQTNHWHRFADIPAVFSSGWYDPFPADAAGQFAHLAKHNAAPQRLILGPWNHLTMRGRGASSVQEVEFGPAALWGDAVYNVERLRWFDRWLKDMDTGVEKDPPVRIFVMGGGTGRKTPSGRLDHGGAWRSEQEWPLARIQYATYYLRGDGGLSAEAPDDGDEPARWTHDPARPVPTLGAAVTGFYEWVEVPEGINRDYLPARARMRSLIADGPMHQRERPGLIGCVPPYSLLAERPDVMVFQTPALAQDVEVTGAARVVLWVSSSAPDTDFTAKLLDIYPPSIDYPEGFHLPLCDSILRARYRNGFDHEEPMESGERYEITIELPPISNQFKAGHRIRLDIASSNFPRFDVNPNTGEPMGRHTGSVPAHNNVHFDREYPSRILLPVIPTLRRTTRESRQTKTDACSARNSSNAATKAR